MRIILLTCSVLAATTAAASAQTTYVGPWRPTPTISVALGAFGAITRNGGGHPIVSGAIEIPFSQQGRIRIEAARSALAIVPESAPDSRNPTDTAHIERLSISLAALAKPGAPVSAYGGAGVGLYRTTFDIAPKVPPRVDGQFYGGAELPLSDRLTLDAEVVIEAFKDDPWYHRQLITGEAMIRIKVGL